MKPLAQHTGLRLISAHGAASRSSSARCCSYSVGREGGHRQPTAEGPGFGLQHGPAVSTATAPAASPIGKIGESRPGIEPFFSFLYFKKIKFQKYMAVTRNFKKWAPIAHGEGDRPLL